jgi:hypothetical protein
MCAARSTKRKRRQVAAMTYRKEAGASSTVSFPEAGFCRCQRRATAPFINATVGLNRVVEIIPISDRLGSDDEAYERSFGAFPRRLVPRRSTRACAATVRAARRSAV